MTISEIEKIVCKGEELTPAQLQVKTRVRNIKEARQIIFYFAVMFKCGTLQKIGEYYKLDHATVYHSKKTIESLITVDRILLQKIDGYEQKIKSIERPFDVSDLEKKIYDMELKLADMKFLKNNLILEELQRQSESKLKTVS